LPQYSSHDGKHARLKLGKEKEKSKRFLWVFREEKRQKRGRHIKTEIEREKVKDE